MGRKTALALLGAAYLVAMTSGRASAHSGHDHDDHDARHDHAHHGPFGWLGHRHSHNSHGHGDIEHSDDYYGRITHIEGRTIYARSMLGLGPEWSFEIDDQTLIERWDGSEKWELSNLGRGQYVHVMYEMNDGKHLAKAIHVSWTAQAR